MIKLRDEFDKCIEEIDRVQQRRDATPPLAQSVYVQLIDEARRYVRRHQPCDSQAEAHAHLHGDRGTVAGVPTLQNLHGVEEEQRASSEAGSDSAWLLYVQGAWRAQGQPLCNAAS